MPESDEHAELLELRERLAELQAAHEVVAFAERLPAAWQKIYVWSTSRRHWLAWGPWHPGAYCPQDGVWRSMEITHWRPYLAPPPGCPAGAE